MGLDNADAPISQRKVKSAYYKLAFKHHPDKTGGKSAAKFREIQTAYEVLSNERLSKQWEDSRKGYQGFDDFGGARRSQSDRSHGPQDDGFGDPFHSRKKEPDFNDLMEDVQKILDALLNAKLGAEM